MKKYIDSTIAVIVGVLLVVGSVQAATTISENISTGGSLSVTGVTSLIGNVGIGTTSLSIPFSVQGTGVGDENVFQVLDDNGNSTFAVRNNGTVIFNSENASILSGGVFSGDGSGLTGIVASELNNNSGADTITLNEADKSWIVGSDFGNLGLKAVSGDWGITATGTANFASAVGIGTTSPNTSLSVVSPSSLVASFEFAGAGPSYGLDMFVVDEALWGGFPGRIGSIGSGPDGLYVKTGSSDIEWGKAVTQDSTGATNGVVKIYRALLTQSGTSAPVATVLENSLGGTVVWSRNGIGEYIATLTGEFPASKTFAAVHNTNVIVNDPANFSIDLTGQPNYIRLLSSIGDGELSQTPIEILVYP